ncbi:hypothetical protein ACFSL4_26105 [Streptomyces caeni]|uniref:Secreted protein n=1 Tax=Streptomyces caeni TaxID=2307231 RepID=A0ABW4IYJ6_9ACTN
MTLPSTLPFTGPALRTMRTAAGRRALYLALLVAGLVALGLLCGERAQATEGTPPALTAPAAPMASGTPAGAVRDVVETVGRTERSLSTVAVRAVTGPSSPLAHLAPPAAAPGHAPDGRLPLPASGPRPARHSGAHATEPGTAPVTAPPAPEAHPTRTAPGTPADDSGTSVTGTLPAVSGTVRRAVRPVTEGLVHPVGDTVLRPVSDTLLWPVGDTVVRPVGDLLQTVTGGLADASAQWPPLSSLPSLPGLPSLPALPEPPGPPTAPVYTLPTPAVPQQPGGGTGHRAAVKHRPGGEYGPRDTRADAGEYAHRAPHAGRSARLPRHQAPDGDPTGALGGRPATDGGAPRHDGHAVAANHRAPLRLVPGATAVVTADGTRDRHRDIPEFPG